MSIGTEQEAFPQTDMMTETVYCFYGFTLLASLSVVLMMGHMCPGDC